MGLVSTLGEPDGVSSGTATNVGDHRGRRREISLQQHLGTGELERALATEEPVSFEAEGVERGDVAGVASLSLIKLPGASRRFQMRGNVG